MCYYLIETMCGHVGDGKFIPVIFPVTGENPTEAKEKVLMIPRVKHTNRHAIISIRKVDKNEYINQQKINRKDPYLNWRRDHKNENYSTSLYSNRIENMKYIEWGSKKQKRHSKRVSNRREEMYLQNEINEYILDMEA